MTSERHRVGRIVTMDTAREFGFDVGRMENEIDRLRGRINAALLIGHTLTSPCDEHCQINNVRNALTGEL